MKKSRLLLMLAAMIISVASLAQTKGTVIDENGEAVIGATIAVKGWTKKVHNVMKPNVKLNLLKR
jgi:hypothetical protein